MQPEDDNSLSTDLELGDLGTSLIQEENEISVHVTNDLGTSLVHLDELDETDLGHSLMEDGNEFSEPFNSMDSSNAISDLGTSLMEDGSSMDSLIAVDDLGTSLMEDMTENDVISDSPLITSTPAKAKADSQDLEYVHAKIRKVSKEKHLLCKYIYCSTKV